jgi:hypothetical protein
MGGQQNQNLHDLGFQVKARAILLFDTIDIRLHKPIADTKVALHPLPSLRNSRRL